MKIETISKTTIDFNAEDRETMGKMSDLLSKLIDVSENYYKGKAMLYSEDLGQTYNFEDFIFDVKAFLNDLQEYNWEMLE